MNFGEAIKCMKKGKKVTRNVWKENFFNGRKQFIFIGKNKGLTTNTFLAILPEEECFSDCIMGYTRKGIFQPNWTPTQEDMLAEDWEMYPAEGFPLVGQHIHVQKAEIKKLNEKHPLMRENCDLAECEKYFNDEPPTVSNRKVEPGQVYRHFKGETVKVLYIAQDSEMPGQFKVVYECSNGVWCRPYGMFVSKVDRKKYPDVKQKYRFELVEE